MRVLLVEDDPILGEAVRDQIDADGHTVDWAQRLDVADDCMRTIAYELVLLDLMLPDGRGLDFLKAHRTSGEAFVQRPRVLFSKAQLEERLYSFDAEVESNTIEVYVGRLRKKLGHAMIETVRGMGYRFGQPEDAAADTSKGVTRQAT